MEEKKPKINGYKKWTISLYAITTFVTIATYAYLDNTLDPVTKMNIMIVAMTGIGGVAAGHGLVEGSIDKIKSKLFKEGEKNEKTQ